MTPSVAFAAAAIVAAAVAWWWYGRREERVRGRGVAGFLRATALFLLLSSPWLAPIRRTGSSSASVAILVDHSASMRLPALDGTGRTRLAAALDTIAELRRSRPHAALWALAGDAEPLAVGAIDSMSADGADSRILDGIEMARAAGADSLFVVTDGELQDREAGRRMASRLGLGLTEVRVAGPSVREAIQSISAPRMVEAGDTFEVRVRAVATGPGPDSTRLVARFGRSAERVHVERPTTGRTAEAVLRIPAVGTSDSVEWRPLDLALEGQEAPWDSAGRFRTWIAVTPVPLGAVLVATSPDWESRYLVPLLERVLPGGARAFARIGPDAWVRIGARPGAAVPESVVRRAAQRASLLVVQGATAGNPDWLNAAARTRPAVLHLVRGTGPVAGAPIEAAEPLAGDWFAVTPAPPGPVAASLLGVEVDELPPLARLHGFTGAGARVGLQARTDRPDSRRAAVVFGSEGSRRWAAVLGEGTWRWATRPGQGVALYRGLYEGLSRWLTERTVPRPVELLDAGLRAGDSLRWRVAPEVRDLAIRLSDTIGTVLWSDTVSEPGTALAGPPIGAGEAQLTVSGSVAGTPFRLERPLFGNVSREYVPRTVGPVLEVESARVGGRVAGRGRPPIWPFAVAIALLCAEWLWRRRIGLK